MKRAIIMMLALGCAFFAQAEEPAWKKTLGKVKDFTADMGFMAFMKKEAPAYITGNFASADRAAVPDYTKPRTRDNIGANRNGYYTAYCVQGNDRISVKIEIVKK